MFEIYANLKGFHCLAREWLLMLKFSPAGQKFNLNVHSWSSNHQISFAFRKASSLSLQAEFHEATPLLRKQRHFVSSLASRSFQVSHLH